LERPKAEREELKRFRAEVHFERGRALFLNRKFADALAAFNEALRQDASFLRAEIARAYALKKLGRLDEALASAARAIAGGPRAGLAYAARASIYQDLERRAEAEADFGRAIALSPDEPRVSYNFACFWAVERDEEKCRRYLSRALELDPQSKATAAVDEDFAPFREKTWFLELVAFK
jgi:tetratricopeptide (TPR) repeat protein